MYNLSLANRDSLLRRYGKLLHKYCIKDCSFVHRFPVFLINNKLLNIAAAAHKLHLNYTLNYFLGDITVCC